MKLRDDVNEYGTKITVCLCEYCEREFLICPAVPDHKLDRWRGCTAPDCESYDEGRDVDKMLEEGSVKVIPGKMDEPIVN